MANFRGRSQFSYSYAAKRVLLNAKITIGASGAPTLVSGTGQGIASVSRVSAGKYNITLSGPYNALLGANHVINSGSSAPAAPIMYISSDTSSASTPVIQIQMATAAGVATDPASGEAIHLQIELNDSSLPY